MSLTYKFILDTRRNKEKVTYPVKLRIYQGASYNEHSLRFQIAPEYWNEDAGRIWSTHPEHHSLNAKIVGRRDAVISLIKIAGLNGTAETPATIVSALHRADWRTINPRIKSHSQPTSSYPDALAVIPRRSICRCCRHPPTRTVCATGACSRALFPVKRPEFPPFPYCSAAACSKRQSAHLPD